MSLVLESRLLSVFDLPVQLAQTQLPPGAWLAIATVKIAESQLLDLRWLQIYIAAIDNSDASDPCGTTGKNVINSSYKNGSLASVFLIKDWAPASEPWLQDIIDYLLCPLDANLAVDAIAPVSSVRPLVSPLVITAAGTYTVVVLNNTTNRNLSVTVDGTITVDTDTVAT